MKIRSAISVIFLSVYSIILAHNFIPHDHHSSEIGCHAGCHTQNIQLAKECGVVHHNDDGNVHSHLHCHFNVKTIKQEFASPVFCILSENSDIFLPKETESDLPFFYLTEKLPDHLAREVGSRAPPIFA